MSDQAHIILERFNEAARAEQATRGALSGRIDRARKRIAATQRFITRLQRREDKIHRVDWVKEFILPLTNFLAPHFPQYTLGIIGPCGLGPTVSIIAYEPGTEKLPYEPEHSHGSLDIRPRHQDDGGWRFVWVDYSRKAVDYSPNSVGAINGLQYATEPLPTAANDLVALFARHLRDRAE